MATVCKIRREGFSLSGGRIVKKASRLRQGEKA